MCTNIRAPNYIKQKLIKLKKRDKSKVIVGDFNISLSVTDRTSAQKSVRIETTRTAQSINLT